MPGMRAKRANKVSPSGENRRSMNEDFSKVKRGSLSSNEQDSEPLAKSAHDSARGAEARIVAH